VTALIEAPHASPIDGLGVDDSRATGQVAAKSTIWDRLLKDFVKRLEYRTLKPAQRWLQPWRYVTYGDICVHYKRHLDGGGSSFGQDYIPFLHDRGMPRQPRVFEWCAGPAFIGLSLLGFGLCDTLCLADINPEAVRACRRTIAGNGLADRVAVYRSDNLDNIPASERWDLVVGNPPHFDWAQIGEIRIGDSGWNIHRRFFASVGRFLKPGGAILIQENNRGSTVETFRQMIEDAGFSIVLVHGCEPRLTPYTRYYYLGIMRRGDTSPPWLAG
jgi:SAM-dependent methyltransferase